MRGQTLLGQEGQDASSRSAAASADYPVDNCSRSSFFPSETIWGGAAESNAHRGERVLAAKNRAPRNPRPKSAPRCVCRHQGGSYARYGASHPVDLDLDVATARQAGRRKRVVVLCCGEVDPLLARIDDLVVEDCTETGPKASVCGATRPRFVERCRSLPRSTDDSASAVRAV